MTELNGLESEEDRIVTITKIVLKFMKQNNAPPQGTRLLTEDYVDCRQVKWLHIDDMYVNYDHDK
jgi:hypothetical protein